MMRKGTKVSVEISNQRISANEKKWKKARAKGGEDAACLSSCYGIIFRSFIYMIR